MHNCDGQSYLLFVLSSEIEDFLTEQECDDIIFMAQTQGLERSLTLGEEIPVGEERSANRTAERFMPEDPADTFQQLDVNVDGHLDLAEVSINKISFTGLVGSSP